MPHLISIAAISAWMGAAILVAAVVAPSAFAVLPTRSLAGALVGRVLPVVFWAGITVSVIALALVRSAPSGRAAMAGCMVMLLSCAAAQFVIGPRIEHVRASINGPVDALAVEDPRRRTFGRLHGLSVLAMGVAGVGSAIALVALVRTATVRGTA